MNRTSLALPFLLGTAVAAWVGVGFVPANPFALLMTLIVFAVFLAGTLELREFRRQTASLNHALASLADVPARLDELLDRLHPSLRNAVRLRVEGERVGLPGPALTPYLVGLLVMLGMLGTFLGMVATFKGAGFALEGTTDFETIRAALTAPIKGLGLAFGTSVAGVATSAMLGLMSALSRSERQRALQALDAAVATRLYPFSLAYQRAETHRALQLQTQALPTVIDKLEALMAALERQSQQLNERLLDNQQSFQRDIEAVYGELARSVDQTLRHSLADSVRAAGDNIRPVAEATLNGIARETAAHHERLLATTQAQIDALLARIAATAAEEAAARNAALAKHEQASAGLVGELARTMAEFGTTVEQRSTALLASIHEAFARVQAEQADGERERQATLAQSLEAMAATLRDEWQSAGRQGLARQREICGALEQTARDVTAQARADADATLAQITKLLATAAEAPRAAAAVIGEMREQNAIGIARDNEVLAERSRIMQALQVLLDAVNRTASEQHAAMVALATSSETLLGRVGEQFAARVDAESGRLAAGAAQIGGSAIEVAALAESFNLGVQRFGDANVKLIESLQRIEAALDKSAARSDEQLAYYVAQAREIVDLSLLSQKGMLDDLRARQSAAAPLNAEAC